MPLFSYKAKNVAGEQVSAVIEAENIKEVVNKLRVDGYFTTSITECNQNKAWARNLNIFKFKSVRRKDIVLFTRRLSDSVKGGLPLARALNVLANQTDNREFASITKELAVSINEGKSFSEALEKYPEMFSKMYVAMVRAGETAGVVDVVLARLADFNEKEEDLRFRINSALAYPVMMLGVGAMSVIFLLGFVIPKFEVMFQDMGQAMPLPTRILIFISHILRHGWWIYLPVILLIIVLAKNWYSKPEGRYFVSNLKLKLPIFGNFLRKDLISRFIRMLSILLTNGVPILDALNIARNSMDDRTFSDEIDKIYIKVKEGQGLSQPLKHSKLFPALVSEMIAVGEETGNMESSLVRIADIYEREVEYAVKTMTSLLEPVIILFAGIIVCFIALSMLLPVFQISGGIR